MEGEPIINSNNSFYFVGVVKAKVSLVLFRFPNNVNNFFETA